MGRTTRTYTCSVCGQKGHNKRACGKNTLPDQPVSPHLPAAATADRKTNTSGSGNADISDMFAHIQDMLDDPEQVEDATEDAGEDEQEPFTLEDLETWWELAHARENPQQETSYPKSAALNPKNYNYKQMEKETLANTDSCVAFLSTIPDSLSLRTPPEQWRAFMEHFPIEVTLAALKDVRTPSGVLSAYAEYADGGILAKPVETFQVFDNDRVSFVGAVGQNPHTPENALTHFAEHSNPWVRETVAQNSNLPLFSLLKLTEDSDLFVQTAALSNPKCPPDTVIQHAHDPSWQIRWLVAARPDCPETVRQTLCEDEHECVRNVAKDEQKTPLGKRKKPKKKTAAPEHTPRTSNTVTKNIPRSAQQGTPQENLRHVGVRRGTPVIVAGKVSKTRYIQTDYGGSKLIAIDTPAGEISMFTTATWAYEDVAQGSEIVVKGVVRKHGEFAGRPNTTLGRVKLLTHTAKKENADE